MENTAVSLPVQQNFLKNKTNMKYISGICFLFSILILGRAVSNAFFYLFAGISAFVFAVSSISHCFPLLLFLLPFAPILKQNVNDMTFFTILFFIVILKMVVKNKKIDAYLLLYILVFTAYCMIFSGFGQLTTIVTMVAGMVMLYYIRNTNIDINASIIAFSVGICLSSALALMKNSFPIINSFVSDTMLRLGEDTYASRFSGLHGNPNYYTMDIIIALASIIVVMNRSKFQKTYTVCLVALSVFGIMSVSKSFLLCWAMLLVFWMVLSLKQGAKRLIYFMVIAFFGAAVIYYFAHDYVNTYLIRFSSDEQGTLESITTGRSDIWKAYIDIIFDDIKIMFFGNGLNTVAKGIKGTHNTYLECIFSLGIFGTILYLTALKTSLGKIVTKRIMWIPLLMLFIRMFAIGILTYDNLWFYLALFVLLAKLLKKPITQNA